MCQVAGSARSRLWNETIARDRYLGYTPLAGSQSRYLVFASERFIGWQEDQRQRNLSLVVNNARFLILPWIQSKGLASKILSLIQR